MEVAKALEGVKGDAVIDGELVAIGKDGVSHFQLVQNALFAVCRDAVELLEAILAEEKIQTKY